MNSGPSRKRSSPRRAVDDHRAGDVAGHQVGGELHPPGVDDSAPARVRTSSVLATPGHALHQHVPAAQQGDEQPGDGGVLADDGLGDLGADGGQPLAAPRSGVGPGSPGARPAWFRCSCAAYLSVELGQSAGQGDQVVVGGRGGARSAEQRGRRSSTGGPSVPGDVADQARPSASPAAAAGARAAAGAGGRAQRVGGVRPVAGAAVEPTPAAGGLDGPAPTTGSGSVASGPSRRPRHRTSATSGRPRRARGRGGSQRGSSVRQAHAVVGDQVVEVGDVPDQPVAAGRAAAARRRRCRPAAPGRCSATSVGAEQDQPGRGARPPARRARRGSSRRARGTRAPRSTSSGRPVERAGRRSRPPARPAGPTVSGRRRRPRARSVVPGPGRDQHQVGAPACRRAAAGPCCRPSWSVEVTSTVVPASTPARRRARRRCGRR